MPAITNGATLVLPKHKAARLTIAPDIGTLGSQHFSGGGKIFTLQAGGSANEKRIVPTGKLGTEDLDFNADADPDQGTVTLNFSIHVNVIAGLATRLSFLYEVPGALPIWCDQNNGVCDLPMNKTATVTVKALDDQNNVIPLGSPVFSGSGIYFTITPTADPQKVTVTPIGVGSYDPVLLNADADVGPDTVAISGFVNIRVTAAIATALSASYTLEAP